MPQNPPQAVPGRLKVLAAVIRRDGRVLIARRKSSDRFGGKWEFPGGKLEPGETPADCLKREILEEFGVEVRVGRFLGSARSDFPDVTIELDAYEVHPEKGEFELRDHDELRWVLPSEVAGFDLTEPDRRLLDRVVPDAADGGGR
jgi:8-oxo-dGTP diphosphatase